MGSEIIASRRAFIALAAGLAVGFARGSGRAQDGATPDGTPAAGLAEAPSSGVQRGGPVIVGTGELLTAARKGVPPVSIKIEQAGVDAPVERIDIVDGVMQNPSGPWVVSWYEDLPAPGAGSNVVMAGHVDYWDVGPAVFQSLNQLKEGDRISVGCDGGKTFDYAVEWQRDYIVAEMTAADINEIIGPTPGDRLTLITCAIGTFDPATQEYRARTALRARQVV